ncbi:lipoprotein LpqV [Mycobacterium parmense]|uniref:lipoprotein LpqV n=1 Tax=Mycobacterium parmense TaxID=185642 RepID=UPI00146FC2E8|nr:lipoprotein LpqV [Mycobacterium parmense]MCV7349386.1 lipoprotein LpqV [Mycobacterium parmense]
MRPRSHRPLLWGGVVLVAGLWPVVGCSHAPQNAGTAPSPAPSTAARGGPGSAPPGAVGLSPGGVTTRVDVPADSTEEQYYQACHAAKVWMDAQPKTGQAQLEPYLAMVQAAPSGTPGTWNHRWADLTPARQAAVITAARAAAADECG